MALNSSADNNMITGLGNEVQLPKMIRVRQKLNAEHIEPDKIAETVLKEMARKEIKEQIQPGMRVAITCGSRGITNIAVIIKAIVEAVKDCGGVPFVFPAMGSHGGATAEGQVKILTGYHVTEEFIGCPIRASMEVVQIGNTQEGMPVYIDRYAYHADAVILCGRIKPHTGFRGPYESGLMKMAVIGMGKQHGAETVHQDGFSDLGRLLPMIGSVVLENTNVICGLGIVENAFDETCLIKALAKDEIYTEEPKLLQEAYDRMGKLYLNNLDVLVVDQIGKDVSGDGMDPNVTGRYMVSHLQSEYHVQRIAVLDLTEETHGNFVGLGNADVTTRRVIEKLNVDATYPNAVTSTVLLGSKIPLFTHSDRTCVQIALKTCNYIDRSNPRIIRIKDTQHLEYIEISEALLEEAKKDERIEIAGELQDWDFNDTGNLW